MFVIDSTGSDIDWKFYLLLNEWDNVVCGPDGWEAVCGPHGLR